MKQLFLFFISTLCLQSVFGQTKNVNVDNFRIQNIATSDFWKNNRDVLISEFTRDLSMKTASRASLYRLLALWFSWFDKTSVKTRHFDPNRYFENDDTEGELIQTEEIIQTTEETDK